MQRERNPLLTVQTCNTEPGEVVRYSSDRHSLNVTSLGLCCSPSFFLLPSVCLGFQTCMRGSESTIQPSPSMQPLHWAELTALAISLPVVCSACRQVPLALIQLLTCRVEGSCDTYLEISRSGTAVAVLSEAVLKDTCLLSSTFIK